MGASSSAHQCLRVLGANPFDEPEHPDHHAGKPALRRKASTVQAAHGKNAVLLTTA
jgi:hypothetical protein